MALTSPRFTSSHTLNKIAANSATLRVGSAGRAVHLVQMALLDLGYAMPSLSEGSQYQSDTPLFHTSAPGFQWQQWLDLPLRRY